MPNIVIRNATISDAAAIVKTEKAITTTPGLLCSLPSELSEDKVCVTIQQNPTLYFVAEVQGEIVGHAFIEPHPLKNLSHGGDLTIAISPERQKQGIGKQLLTHLIQQAKEQGLEKIKLNVRATNTIAIALYKKMGFQIEGRLKNHLKIQGNYIDDLIMGLDLISSSIKASGSFAVIYQAYVKAGQEQTYQEAWKRVAQYFIEQRGAIGSCLHRTEEGMWVAYSRWPDQKTRDASWPINSDPSDELPEKIRQAILTIKSCLDPQRKMPDLCMEVVDDLLLQ